MTVQRVAYVVNMFPKVSETFIVNEIAELTRRGVDCRVLSLERPTETLRHAVVDTLRSIAWPSTTTTRSGARSSPTHGRRQRRADARLL